MKRRPFRSLLRGGHTLTTVLGFAIGCGALFAPGETENAVANGDTRTIQLYHVHTKESITATYLVNGSYDQAVLDKLNWFLRDWRRDEPTKMDPRLFDVVWEVYRESGSRQPVEVMSAYRSPETNAMLRRRSRGVAEHSQHILGKAMDQHYFDVPMSKIREIAMRLQRGGVGFYPTAGTPFVHMDVGGVRHWPRMSYDQLAHLFPDGKTVHIPSNGQPLAGYEEARAELEARGDSSYPTASEVKSKGFFAWLFGSGDDEQDDAAASRDDTRGRAPAPAPVRTASTAPAAAPTGYSGKNGDTMTFVQTQASQAASAAPPVARPALPAPAPVAPNRDTASAEAKLALAMSMQQQVESPQPYEASAQASAPAPAAQPVVPDAAVSSPVKLADGIAVPLPPSRPVELAQSGIEMPMPPVRPAEFSRPVEAPAPTAQQVARLDRADAISTLLATRGALPNVITQGSSRGSVSRPAAAPAVMAYASGVAGDAPAAPMPVPRPADLVSARLDRSNFRSLTSGAKAEKTVPRSAMGSSVVGIRAAARASTSAFSTVPASSSFGSKASDLSTDTFTGAALKPNAKLVTAKRSD